VRKNSSFFLLVVHGLGLLHALLFTLYWLANGLFSAQVNNFLFEKIGRQVDYIRLALVFSVFILLWSIVRLLSFKHKGQRPGWGARLFTAAIVFFIVFFYGSFWVLFSQSPVQWIRLIRLAAYFRILLDMIFLTGLAGLFRKAGKKLSTVFSGQASKKIIIGMVFLVFFILLWSVPLMIPPVSVYRQPLPPRPLIIAHRGASMLAPENTLAAAQRAEALGADGLEVDIRISLDGVPFLIHDSSLQRTTDVARLFPERVDDRPEDFSLAELKQLSAGDWFYQQDPYNAIANGLVSSIMVKEMRSERIPTLAEVLDFLKDNDQVFIFDLLNPPPEHPYHDRFFDICFSLIHKAGFDSRVWFLVKGEERELVVSSAPQMILTYGADYTNPPEARELAEKAYQIINVDFGLPIEWIRQYQQAGLKVNLYVVDEPWMFSRFWLAGADSITTNNVHSMIALDRPAFSLPFSTYLFLWGLFGILGLGLTFS